VNTETTDYTKYNGVVLYDGDCPTCVRLARRLQPLLARRGFRLAPLQTSLTAERFGLDDDAWSAEMRLALPDGRVFGGADAVVAVAGFYWWAKPICLLAAFPPIRRQFRTAYRWVARHRSCAAGACPIRPSLATPRGGAPRALDTRIPHFRTAYLAQLGNAPTKERRSVRGRVADLGALTALVGVALAGRARLAPWVFMWAMAGALYAGCKWLTFREALRRGVVAGRARSAGYLFGWPGMDAAGFLGKQRGTLTPRGEEWISAWLKTAFGAAVIWGCVRFVARRDAILAAWTGMIGVTFLLHFGVFHLLSLAWRRAGLAATPLMRNPAGARSVTEFWGRRWNTAFHELAFRFAFRPLARVFNPATATLLVFGLSGLTHELVISLPGGGGYGLPTLYFIIQGVGTLGEKAFQNLRLGRNLSPSAREAWARFFTIAVAAGPAYWLFPPPFLQRVILPMLKAIGAL